MQLYTNQLVTVMISCTMHISLAALLCWVIQLDGAAAFSFSASERLTDHIVTKLDALHQQQEVDDVEASATMLRTFVNNIVKSGIGSFPPPTATV